LILGRAPAVVNVLIAQIICRIYRVSDVVAIGKTVWCAAFVAVIGATARLGWISIWRAALVERPSGEALVP
jgi:hypothetical protein